MFISQSLHYMVWVFIQGPSNQLNQYLHMMYVHTYTVGTKLKVFVKIISHLLIETP
jgi:hypothetical protein